MFQMKFVLHGFKFKVLLNEIDFLNEDFHFELNEHFLMDISEYLI